MTAKFTLLTLFLSILTLSAISQREGDWTVMNPTNLPEARFGHSMVTIPDGRVMLFGGEGAHQNLFNDLIVYNNYNWEYLTPANNPPSPRRDHEAWMQGDKMFVYGGTGEDGSIDDMWSYDISDNKYNVQVTPNPTSGPVTISANKRIEKIFVYDVNGRLVLEQMESDQEVSVKLSSYENGIYFIKIQIDNNIISGKIMLIK